MSAQMLGLIGGLPDSKVRNDDDFSDRLSHRYTTGMLILCAIIVSTKQYVGDPITCWAPAEFTDNHEGYANSYCWVRSTYYLPWSEDVQREGRGPEKTYIPYYQWVPLILLVQALVFYLPCLLWRGFNGRTGIDVNSIVEAGETFQNTEKSEGRDKTLEFMTRQMHRYLVTSPMAFETGCTSALKAFCAKTFCACCGKHHSAFLILLYFVVKLLYAANVIGQIFILDLFLDNSFSTYGLDVIRSLSNGEDWSDSPRFPRVTMCDFKVRRLGNIHRYTVQCVLPINLFNEMIYLFIWFWMVMVATVTCLSLLMWIIRSIFRSDRHRYVKKHLKLTNKLSTDADKKLVVHFVEKYLRINGYFVLRLLAANTNSLTATEFISSLWDHWKSHM